MQREWMFSSFHEVCWGIYCNARYTNVGSCSLIASIFLAINSFKQGCSAKFISPGALKYRGSGWNTPQETGKGFQGSSPRIFVKINLFKMLFYTFQSQTRYIKYRIKCRMSYTNYIILKILITSIHEFKLQLQLLNVSGLNPRRAY